MLKVANSVINASQITGVLPVANGGTGVTTSTGTGSTVLSAAPTLSGDVTLSTGNLIPSTAAKGVNFTANTPAAGMTSQLLNLYEEGTWTPNQGSGLTVVGAFSSSGRYTRIGRLVTVHFSVSGATTVAGAGGGVITSNLPFATAGVAPVGAATNNTPNASSTVQAGGTTVYLATAIPASASIYVTLTYQA